LTDASVMKGFNWQANVLIPMAGHGQRFKDAGYKPIKPLIDVDGLPMIVRVLENLMPVAHKIAVIVLAEHEAQVREVLDHHYAGVHVVVLAHPTEGAAETVIKGFNSLSKEDESWLKQPLLVANCDQYMDWSPSHFTGYMHRSHAAGGIVTFKASGPKWSYVTQDLSGLVTSVVEKRQVSNDATVGVYWFSQGQYMAHAVFEMCQKDIRTNGEYYFAPCYNEIIFKSLPVRTYPIPRMYPMGTPADLEATIETGLFAE